MHDAYPTGQGDPAGVGVVAAVAGSDGEAADVSTADAAPELVASGVGTPDADDEPVETGLPDTDELNVNAGLPETDEVKVEAGLPDTDEVKVEAGLPDKDEVDDTVDVGDCVLDADCVVDALSVTEGLDVALTVADAEIELVCVVGGVPDPVAEEDGVVVTDGDVLGDGERRTPLVTRLLGTSAGTLVKRKHAADWARPWREANSRSPDAKVYASQAGASQQAWRQTDSEGAGREVPGYHALPIRVPTRSVRGRAR